MTYSKSKAVNYAVKYATSPNPNFSYFSVYKDAGGDCTNFTSQCLLAGGAPMTFTSQNPWWYKGDSFSLSWSTASGLYYYLISNYSNNLYGIKGLETPNISSLEAGDLIFYENNNRKMAHSAIITDFYYDYPLISQHTPNLLNIPYEKAWAYKLHFLKIFL